MKNTGKGHGNTVYEGRRRKLIQTSLKLLVICRLNKECSGFKMSMSLASISNNLLMGNVLAHASQVSPIIIFLTTSSLKQFILQFTLFVISNRKDKPSPWTFVAIQYLHHKVHYKCLKEKGIILFWDPLHLKYETHSSEHLLPSQIHSNHPYNRAK